MTTGSHESAHEALRPTSYVDSDHPTVRDFARDTTGGLSDPTEQVVALFRRVRDEYRYNPYDISRDAADYRASAIVDTAVQWCVPKAVLLTAAVRSLGIPARLGFADVRNHLTSPKLAATMGTDLFAWHGYSVVELVDPATGTPRWFKLSSAFNLELCERFGVKVLDFDGTADALMHPFDQAGRRHMEYVHDRGVFNDLPFEEMMSTFADVYGDGIHQTTDTRVDGGNDDGDDPFAAR